MSELGFPARERLQKLWEQGKDDDNKAALRGFGGPVGLANALQTDVAKGIEPATVDARRASYGVNIMPKAKQETWLSLFLGSFGDEVLIIL